LSELTTVQSTVGLYATFVICDYSVITNKSPEFVEVDHKIGVSHIRYRLPIYERIRFHTSLYERNGSKHPPIFSDIAFGSIMEISDYPDIIRQYYRRNYIFRPTLNVSIRRLNQKFENSTSKSSLAIVRLYFIGELWTLDIFHCDYQVK
ncbi:hypothetical protein L9F63_014949, partial [Diploptera punctata]